MSRPDKLCTRCKSEFQWRHPMQNICDPCIKKNPKLTSAEKSDANSWDMIDVVWDIVQKSRAHDWSWASNTACKYLDVRIDMRDGGCIIKDRSGKRIGPDALAWQYSKEQPERPET